MHRQVTVDSGRDLFPDLVIKRRVRQLYIEEEMVPSESAKKVREISRRPFYRDGGNRNVDVFMSLV